MGTHVLTPAGIVRSGPVRYVPGTNAVVKYRTDPIPAADPEPVRELPNRRARRAALARIRAAKGDRC